MSPTSNSSGRRVNPVLTVADGLRSRLASFSNDDRGAVAMIFGLMAVVMVMLMGAAVDTGRWLHAHSQTKAAVDAAVLAGARSLQVTAGDAEAALTIASEFYKSNVVSRPEVKKDTIEFTVNETRTAVKATGTAFINTPFLAIANIKELALWKDGGSESSEASSEIGGNSGQELEISIMLDVTGSMAGDKLESLKDAANDLIDILLPENREGAPARIALAPFAESVRPGSLLNAVRGTRAASIKVKDRSGKLQTYKLSPCVSERTGSDAYTGAKPEAGKFLGAVYSKSGSCTPGAEIVPLTSDKAKLKATVAGLTASGGTAGHLGSSWAWYLLSPTWAGVLTGEAQPAAYDNAGVKKIAILMTDGEYNTQYDANGIMTSTNGTAPVNSASNTQARTVCSNMKAEGVEVYTVGFDLENGTAIETLKHCATNPGTAYLVQDGDQLRNAFRDIAIKLSPLHLTN